MNLLITIEALAVLCIAIGLLIVFFKNIKQNKIILPFILLLFGFSSTFLVLLDHADNYSPFWYSIILLQIKLLIPYLLLAHLYLSTYLFYQKHGIPQIFVKVFILFLCITIFQAGFYSFIYYEKTNKLDFFQEFIGFIPDTCNFLNSIYF